MFEKIKRAKKRNKSRRQWFSFDGHTRLLLLAFLWCFGFALIVVRLVKVQVSEHDYYQKTAKSYIEYHRSLPAQRGTITDRNGELLAVDLMHYSLAVKPRLIKDKQSVAKSIAKVLKLSANEIYRKINKNKSFVSVKHRLNPDEAAQLRALKIKGLILDKGFNRAYPYAEVGAHILGYCDFDNAAKAGLEMQYNKVLTGKPGSSIFMRDALGNYFPDLDFPMSEPQNGMNIETTIDVVYQGILEEEIKKAVLTNKAINGSAVLMNPRTGEILGMANYPQYDPNQYNKVKMRDFRNCAISDLYEPGSTFKMVSLALCLDQLKLDMDNELVFCENGRYKLARKTVRDHQKFAYLTARRVFEQSSNIGVIKLSQKFDAPVFYRYARDFGFGQKTGIDLPAEEAGILHKPSEFSRYSVSYMSIGYEVAVTPLQIANAYAAIANGGTLMKPYVVRRVSDESGRTVHENKPQAIRQVISEATARQMKDVLLGVVENGTGRSARVSGVTIGGKTGTAQKINKTTNSYTSESHIASFAGFFPVENPKFVLLVMVNNPRNGKYYGSQVAAPAFRTIAQRIVGLAVEDEPVSDINLAHVELPSLNQKMVALEGLKVDKAVKILRRKNLKYEVIGDGELVYRQEPNVYSVMNAKEKVRLFTEAKEVKQPTRMPKVTGMSMKEALRVLSGWNVPVEVEGSGIVTRQLPVAGKKLEKNGSVKLICNPA